MKDHIVKWRDRAGISCASEWQDERAAKKQAEELFDNGMSKIVVERSHVCGRQPVLMLRC